MVEKFGKKMEQEIQEAGGLDKLLEKAKKIAGEDEEASAMIRMLEEKSASNAVA